MKGGIAAALVAVERLAQGERPAGDVLLAWVIDEEWASLGAEALVERHRADAAVLPEQTDLDVVFAHGGFVWYDVVSAGRESAGGEPQHGQDGIALAGAFLTGLIALDRELETRTTPEWGRPNVHASTIRGGQNYPSYPAECVIGVERCLMPGESVAQSHAEIESLLGRARAADPRFSGRARVVIAREPVLLGRDEPIVSMVTDAARDQLGHDPVVRSDYGWMDSGVLVDAGIPCVVFGPTGAGLHTAGEWVRPGLAGALRLGVRAHRAELLRRMTGEPLLALRDLRVSFRTEQGVVKAVDGLDLDLQAGEVLGVVGESGSGKSVSMLALLGLIDDPNAVVEGQALFRGRDLLKLPERELRRLRGREAAMIFQDPMTSLNPVYTVGGRSPSGCGHTRRSPAGRPTGAPSSCCERRHPRAPAPRPRLSPPVLGRHAPARDDRDGALVQPVAADRR